MPTAVIRQSNFSAGIKHQHQHIRALHHATCSLPPPQHTPAQQFVIQTPHKRQFWLTVTSRYLTVCQALLFPTCPRAEQMIHFLLPKLFSNEELVAANSAPGKEAALKPNPDNFTGMAAQQRLAGTSGDHPGWPGAGWSGPWPVRFWVSPLMETPQPLCNSFQCLITGKEEMPKCSPEVSLPACCTKPLHRKTCTAASHMQHCSLSTHLISLNTTLLVAHYMVLWASLRLRDIVQDLYVHTAAFPSPPVPAHEVCNTQTQNQNSLLTFPY